MAAVAAPTIGGTLVQWLGAPVAVLVDAASYLWSASWLRSIDDGQPRPAPAAAPRLWPEVREGLRYVFGDPSLRAMACNGAANVLFLSGINAIVIVFLVRTVHLSPAAIGLLSSAGLTGAVLAAVTARRLANRLGSARTLLAACFGLGAAQLVLPLTAHGVRLACYVISEFPAAFCIITINVVQISFRQAQCPPHLLGRMNATMGFMLRATAPVGSLLAGVVGSAFGLRTTLWCAGVGLVLAPIWLLCAPIARSRNLLDHPVG